MIIILTLIVELIALLGHAILWIWYMNKIHSMNFRERILDAGVSFTTVMLLTLPCWAAWHCYHAGVVPFGDGRFDLLPVVLQAYFWFCTAVCGIGVAIWILRRLEQRPPAQLLSTRVSRYDWREAGQPDADQASWFFRRLAKWPLNEVFRPNFVEHEIMLDRLPPELDGLTVVHLSDLHVNGRIGWGYFEEVVRWSNRQQPDLVMVTGDLVETTSMVEPLTEILGRIEARVGRYFILGNHEKQFDPRPLQRRLSEAGWTSLSGYCDAITIRGHRVLIAGNEAPWFLPSGDFDAVDTHLTTGAARPLRILLSHSPDEIDWAVAKEVDLMLAGHLHGGQIGLPLIGPIRSPSRHGLKYIGGVYYHTPTVLSVSRGTSAELPLRWNCPPELIKLVLRSQ